MKTLLLTLAFSLLMPLSVIGQERVIRQYDRFEDKTRYWTVPTPLRYGLNVTVHFSFKGKGAGKDVEGFYLIFTSIGSGWRFLKNSRLYCLIDGKSVELGSARARDDDVKTGDGSVAVEERMLFTVNYPTLHKIAHAERVEMRLGDIVFHLDQNFRESLKELLGKVKVVKNSVRKRPMIVKR